MNLHLREVSDWKKFPLTTISYSKLIKNTFGSQRYTHGISVLLSTDVCTCYFYKKERLDVKCYNLMFIRSSHDVFIASYS